MAINQNILACIYIYIHILQSSVDELLACTNNKLGTNIFQAEHRTRKNHDNNLQSYDRSYKSDSTPHKYESVYSYSNRVLGQQGIILMTHIDS